ncbi:MAG: hypothetical protein GIW95_06360 [Candidatus Eremiobacteraeota bacterium]|nr:hypothetical protein [Candidatus Eremiobacteraeota bacterium]
MYQETKATDAAAQVVRASRVRHEVAELTTLPQLSAALDLLLDIQPRRTKPHFAELAMADELVFARADGRSDFEYYVGHRTQINDKLLDIAEFLELGPEERSFLVDRLETIPIYR